MKVKTAKNSIKNKVYTASIKIFGKPYTAKGSTITEAISNLKPDRNSKGTAVLTISNGTITREKILGSPAVFKLFTSSPLMREIAIKNVSKLFDL